MRHLPVPSLLLVALAAWTQAASAATPINQTRPLDSQGRIEVENLKGRIQVRAWDRPEVRIAGSLGDGVEKLVVEGDAQHLVINVKYPKSSGWGGARSGPSDLQLTVPLRADLDIESVSANVDVSGVAPSRLSVESVSGDIQIAAAPDEVEVESVSGRLRITVNSASVDVQTVSGDVQLRGRMDGEITAETVSGNLDVLVHGERVRELSASTVSGNAKLQAGLARMGEIKLESVSGDLLLVLPKSLSARVSGESFSGGLRAPGAAIQKPRHGPGSSFNARYGAGEGEIRFETFSGDGELRLE